MCRLYNFFVAGLLLVGFSANAADTHGVLMIVKGDVKVEVFKSKKTEKAKVGFKIFPGDAILTGKDSRAKLVMIDKNVINISPDSKFILEKYVYNPEENKKDVSINVLYGKVRNTVNQKYDGEKNRFHVKTASAVAGVRGTDFVVQYNRATRVAKIFTFKGKVEVGKGFDSLGRIANPVFVTPGQFTVASNRSQPSLPVNANPLEMQTMNNQTDADKAPNPPDPQFDGDGKRVPANDGKNDSSGGMEPERGPNGMAPPTMMDQMGDDTKKDLDSNIADRNKKNPSLPLPPRMPNVCPTGSCLPPQLNPEYFKGNTKLIINIAN